MERQYKDSGIEWIGRIPKDWKTTKLFNLCTIKGRIGWNGLRSDEFKEKSYAYLVTGQDFISSDIKWERCYQIDKERYDEDPFIQLSNGDILITKDGTIGKIAKVSNMDKPACLNSGIFVLKQRKSTFVQNYLYWYLVSPILLAYNAFVNSGGTTIMHLYQNVFERFPLLIPPYSEQQKIAEYLNEKCGMIDGLIALQEQMIAQLAEYKQSVITESVTRGMNPDVQLVPSGIDWIDEIPKGWKACRIKDIVNLQSGTNLTTMDIVENGQYPVYGGNGLRGYYHQYSNDGDFILIGRQGALCGNINYASGKFWATEHAVVCYPRREFAYTWLGELFRAMNLGQYSLSAAQPGLAVERIKNLKMPLPPIAEQYAIAKHLNTKCGEIDRLIEAKQQKIETLKEYKKSVIYEAVTGKINIG